MGFLRQSRDTGDSAQQARGTVGDAGGPRDAGRQQAQSQPSRPGAELEPIAGVPIETYVAVSRELAGVGYHQAQAAGIAASRGISAENWSTAVEGWNERIRRNPAVAQRFNRLYTRS